MKQLLSFLLGACAVALLPNNLWAQIDGEGPCTATAIECGPTYYGSNVGMPDADWSYCGTSTSGSAGAYWYVLDVESNAEITASTCGLNDYDTKLWIFQADACDGTLNCIGGNDDYCGLRSTVIFDAEGGLTYYVVVGGWNNSQGDYQLTISCEDNCDPCDTDLVWNQELSDSSVECVEDLPGTCDEFLAYADAEDLMAVNECSEEEFEVAVCFPFASESISQPATSCIGTTAKRDENLGDDEYDVTDGAIRLYGLSAMGVADSDYFVEDPENPLQFDYAPDSRSARLTGTVHCVLNENQIFEVDARFINEDNAVDWLAEDVNHTLLVADDPNQAGYQTCEIDTASISVFDMQVLSRLEGAGDYNGTLFLDHMPMSYTKRFQLGEGANNHNCNYGFGGWFRWEGELNGTEISGLSGDVVIDLECSSSDGECDEYTQFTLEALGDCGQILSQTVTVERNDVTAPTILDGPADMTVECDAVPAIAGPDAIDATDNCEGDLNISEGLEVRFDGSCPHSYFLDRRWTVTDACGNSTVHTQLITVVDTQAPVITAADALSIACEDYPDNTIYASAVDNCGEVTLTFEDAQASGGCVLPFGVVIRTYTATDECGNSSSKEQIITLTDDVAPVFTFVPADYTLECDQEVTYDDAEAEDNCSGVEITVSEEIVAGSCPNNYQIVRTFTAVDNCDNASEAVQTITIQDTTSPELSIPADYTIECSEELVLDNATATDNCSGVTIEVTEETTPGACAQAYTLVRTFTATDDCGNNTTLSQTITVVDTTAPEFNLSQSFEDFTGAFAPEAWTLTAGVSMDEESISITGYNGGADGVLRSATAACLEEGATVTFDWDYTTDDGPFWDPAFYINGTPVYGLTNPDGPDNQSGSLSFECQGGDAIGFGIDATDGCCGAGFLTITNFSIQSEGLGELPQDEVVECDNVPEAAVLTATDNCQDVSVSFEETLVEGDCPSNYQLNRVWSVADDCGNETIHTQVVTVQDTTAPELTIPADYTAECDEEHPMDPATATDNCGSVDITEEMHTDYSCPHSYVITRTFTATDECGNSTTLTQTITIQDTTAPVIVAEDEITLACEDYSPAVVHATVSDNCGEVTFTWMDYVASGGCVLPYGQYVRVYTAEDECGNVSTFEQVLTLVDDEAPVFTEVPADYTIECFEDVVYGDAAAEDNCSGVTLTLSVDTVWSDCAATYDIVRTWTAVDHCDNESTAVQTISVVDTEGPWFTYVPADFTAECADDLNLEMAEAEDHCSSFTIEVDTDTLQGPCAGQFVILREFIATDACGNVSETTQVIMIEDTTAPEFTFVPADYTAECDEEHPMLDAEAVDACGPTTLTMVQSTEFNGCYSSYTLTRTWTATDDCGNSSSATQVITIVDTTAPDFTFVPADYSLECTEEVTYEDATAMDNCAGMTMELAVDTMFSECDNVYDIIRVWTATDDCGNASTATQVISVVDTTAPQLLSTCGLMNQEVVEVCCEDLDGSLTVPAACEIMFEDNCGQEATMELVETYSGEFAPTSMVDRWCVITDPQALATGETCDGFASHSVHLFNFPGGEFYNTISGTVAHNVDGTMTYTMHVVAQNNPNAGWTIVAQYSAPMDWDEWMAQPGQHSYKSDCGLGDHTTWDYAMLTSGQAEGWGDFEGDSFAMMHQPANGYFGFQIGEGANNKNANYGFSGWFYLSGTVGGQTINSSGDIFGELDCCQPWTLERAYTVTDCSGNETTFTYEVHATGEGCEAEDEGGIAEGEDSSLVTPKDLIQLVDIQPNPSNGMVQFQILTNEITADVDVRLVTMTGQDVMAVYEGLVWEGVAQTVFFDVANLDAGMYQLRLTSKNFMTTKKLLVVH